jgi:transposase
VGKLNELDELSKFLKEIGMEPKKAERLKIQKKDLPETMELWVI